MLIPATAGAELQYRAFASDVGRFTYDASSAYALVPDTFAMEEINLAYVDEELYPAFCSEEHVRFYEETFALMFRMGPRRGACSGEVVKWSTPMEGEACRYEGMHIRDLAEFDFSSPGEIALVNLNLHGYVMNPRAIRAVESHIKALSQKIPDRFAIYLGRSKRYLPMMKNILREEGVPEDMAYLPLIESGFNNKAYSRSRASGQWQFIRGTGKRYGLKINFWVDERRDPVKSTRAAARYLRDLHDMFDSWSLAMAGYNAGENRIKRALKRTEGKDFWSLVSTNYIRRETKNYVPKFIAARLIAVEPEDYGFANIEYEDEFVFDEVTIKFPMSLDVIAKTAGTDVKIIKDLNPELMRWSTPPVKEYKLRVPRGSREEFLANVPNIPPEKRVTVKVHKVKSGESVWLISRKYGVSTRSIIAYNNLNRKGFIRPGQQLIIPTIPSKG